ncbi:TPA: alpha-L-fucosidase [Citrobacter farmeri]
MHMRSQFAAKKFGLFIHWGIYSYIAKGEWALNHIADYNNGTEAGLRAYTDLTCYFTAPEPGDSGPARERVLERIKEIVSTAKAAGMGYILLVTRHHDGYSLWDTKATPWAAAYNSVTMSPSGVDIVRAFAEETTRQGIRLSLYYSLLDWTNPLYPDVLNDVNPIDKEPYSLALYQQREGNMDAYFAFMRTQLEELLTGYGTTIQSLWFDGFWALKDVDKWRIEELYKAIHRASPQTLIGNNKGLGFSSEIEGEGYQISELGLASLGHADEASEVDLTLQVNPMAETADDFWGYNATAELHGVDWVIARLVESITQGHNLVINLGPKASGAIRPAEIEILTTAGKWIKSHHDAIFDVEPAREICLRGTVRRNEKSASLDLYVFLDGTTDAQIKLPEGATLASATLLTARGDAKVAANGIVSTSASYAHGLPHVVKCVVNLPSPSGHGNHAVLKQEAPL